MINLHMKFKGLYKFETVGENGEVARELVETNRMNTTSWINEIIMLRANL